MILLSEVDEYTIRQHANDGDIPHIPS